MHDFLVNSAILIALGLIVGLMSKFAQGDFWTFTTGPAIITLFFLGLNQSLLYTLLLAVLASQGVITALGRRAKDDYEIARSFSLGFIPVIGTIIMIFAMVPGKKTDTPLGGSILPWDYR